MRPRHLLILAALMIALSVGSLALERASQLPGAAPSFQVDPFWPKLPKAWILGQVSGVAVDAQDHVWVLQRPWSLQQRREEEEPRSRVLSRPAPGDGVRLRRQLPAGLGRQARGRLRVAEDEHGIHVDYKGNVWVSSAGGPRMARAQGELSSSSSRATGKFLLQIGRRGMSKGSLDTGNFNNAADICVHPTTNEVFVADGYVNRRVIVLDADTGAFKRMWGAYGKSAGRCGAEGVRRTRGRARAVQHRPRHQGLGRRPRLRDRSAEQPRAGVHARRQSSSARSSSSARPKLLGTSFNDRRFHQIAGQRWLYVADAGNGRVHVFDRRTLQELRAFGRIGRYAGEFVFLHNLATDSAGNLYVSEVGNGRRVQKFVLEAAPRP